jgi:hypothetical protein
MASDTDPNIIIETAGLTAAVATDVAQYSGTTAHFQIFKLAHGITGVATTTSSANPFPVTVAGGLTASITGFNGLVTVQGTGGGYPLPVSGTIIATGSTGSPVYVKTFTGSQIEITGGRLYTTVDSISTYGPSGATSIFVKLVGATGWSIGTSGDALKVAITGATFTATIPSTVLVAGISGATAVAVTVGNTVGIANNDITNGITAIYGQIVGLRTDFTALGVGRPTTFKTGRVSPTSAAVQQMDSGGFTCLTGINIKALSTNTDFIYVGNTSGLVGSSYGYALDPGENVFLDIQNTNKLYAISNTGTQIITYMAS